MKILNIFTDGGARGNPGPAGIGVVVKDGKKTIFSCSTYLGQTTNNEAEYHALKRAFEWLNKNQTLVKSFDQINCYLDSLLVVSQMSGRYKVKAANLMGFITKIKNTEKILPVKVVYHHIGRNKNQEADALVNQALDRAAE
ncbi:MAG: ribonuclease HI family protein [Candidatus Shapirobacteria bacterium]|nr:ribonuclease HI family protein [Candidatus Shapirobacteria bacterium]MDD5073614.1 ribonuclease HI family protein [Candidatus Shapirobacteria bacterium]MDD5481367.1 ribonuclease HI family protein [Candidatus Shapirobacteria bacterium]